MMIKRSLKSISAIGMVVSWPNDIFKSTGTKSTLDIVEQTVKIKARETLPPERRVQTIEEARVVGATPSIIIPAKSIGSEVKSQYPSA